MVFRFLTAILSLALSASVQAQALPAPPTYDYDATTPGIQPPTSPLIQGYESRVFRTFQLSVPMFVPLAELQAILPNGFTAVANPAGSNTALVTLGFVHEQRGERGGGVDGPVSTFVVTTSVRNALLNRLETAILGNEQNEQNSVNNANQIFGDGTARLADMDSQVEEDDGMLHVRFDVSDDDLGLSLKVRAIGPSAIATRVIQSPFGPLRAFSGITAKNSVWVANQFDSQNVTIMADTVRVQAPAHVLRLPGGELKMLSVGTSINFQRWRETFFKVEEVLP